QAQAPVHPAWPICLADIPGPYQCHTRHYPPFTPSWLSSYPCYPARANKPWSVGV
ncbi:hypothetical protein C8Q70DRAFT_980956, partial [Cubamyces menziesii]